jgi:hypothetical protein
MSITGARKFTFSWAALQSAPRFCIPRGTLISSERLDFFAACSMPVGRSRWNCALLLTFNEQGQQ